MLPDTDPFAVPPGVLRTPPECGTSVKPVGTKRRDRAGHCPRRPHES